MNALIRGLISIGFACALSTLALRSAYGTLINAIKSFSSFVPETVATSLVLVAPFVIVGLVINHILAVAFPPKRSNSDAAET